MTDKFCCIIVKEELKEKKVLLLHRNTWWNGWEFLRGDIDGDAQAAVSALILNSLGLRAVKVESIPFNYSYNYLKELNSKEAVVSCFIAKVEGDVSPSEEYDYHKWVEPNNAKSLLEFEEQKKLLNYVNNKYI